MKDAELDGIIPAVNKVCDGGFRHAAFQIKLILCHTSLRQKLRQPARHRFVKTHLNPPLLPIILQRLQIKLVHVAVLFAAIGVKYKEGGSSMKIVTFCGHRDSIITPDIESWLNKSIEYFIQNGAKTFYLGGYGAFDVKVVSVIHKMKAFYPWIESVLVIPYLDFKPDCLQTALYDSFVYPPLETVPRRVAILRRNQWMAEQCDVLIAYIQRETGGAYQTLQWAKKKNKFILQYPQIVW